MSQVAESGLILLVQEIVSHCEALPNDTKLESMGFQVGIRIVERLAKDKPRFVEHLEVVKFICKEFWTTIFKKQIDNLKTNHKVGLFAVQTHSHAYHLRAGRAYLS